MNRKEELKIIIQDRCKEVNLSPRWSQELERDIIELQRYINEYRSIEGK